MESLWCFAGFILYQIAYQCLWNGGVDGIHAHMVAVVGCPAQSQFGEVTRADNNPAALVCQIHEDLCPFSCLTVFIGDIVNGFLLTDVRKMLPHTLLNRNFPQGCPIGFCQAASVLISTVCRTKAGHCNSQHSASWQP